MKRKISICISDFQEEYGHSEALRLAKEIGADAVDFDLCDFFDYQTKGNPYAGSDAEIIAYFSQLGAYAKELGLEIAQTHGRLRGFRNDAAFNETVIENGRRDCIATKALGAKVCVMHTVTTIRMGADADPRLMHQLNYEMFTRLLPFAKENDVVIATETFGDATGLGCCDFFGNIQEFLKGYHHVCGNPEFADYFKVCVDPGHSNKASRFSPNPLPPDVIRMIGGNAIVALHLNDNDTLTDQHKMPFSGSIDWDDLFCALDEIGYRGYYNMELNLHFYGKELIYQTGAFAILVLRNYLNKRYGADA